MIPYTLKQKKMSYLIFFLSLIIYSKKKIYSNQMATLMYDIKSFKKTYKKDNWQHANK